MCSEVCVFGDPNLDKLMINAKQHTSRMPFDWTHQTSTIFSEQAIGLSLMEAVKLANIPSLRKRSFRWKGGSHIDYLNIRPTDVSVSLKASAMILSEKEIIKERDTPFFSVELRQCTLSFGWNDKLEIEKNKCFR